MDQKSYKTVRLDQELLKSIMDRCTLSSFSIKHMCEHLLEIGVQHSPLFRENSTHMLPNNTLDTCDTLGTERTHTERLKTKKESEVTSNRIRNKEKKEKSKLKSTAWKFHPDLIPNELDFCKELLVTFWQSKSGTKSKSAFALLIGEEGLLGIFKRYGKDITIQQLNRGIVGGPRGPWSSITLSHYEKYNNDYSKSFKENAIPTTHPAGKIMTAADFL